MYIMLFMCGCLTLSLRKRWECWCGYTLWCVCVCVCLPEGETGLLVSKITDIAPFVGYANSQQTEKKRLRDVIQKGDLYFNSGDLLKIGQDNFIYFQDRVGDTFRYIS